MERIEREGGSSELFLTESCSANNQPICYGKEACMVELLKCFEEEGDALRFSYETEGV